MTLWLGDWATSADIYPAGEDKNIPDRDRQEKGPVETFVFLRTHLLPGDTVTLSGEDWRVWQDPEKDESFSR